MIHGLVFGHREFPVFPPGKLPLCGRPSLMSHGLVFGHRFFSGAQTCQTAALRQALYYIDFMQDGIAEAVPISPGRISSLVPCRSSFPSLMTIISSAMFIIRS